jgi:hypothetical protein
MIKLFDKQDKPFFIGLFIMNLVLISLLEVFIMHPPDFIKKYKYTEKKDKRDRHENSR